MAYRNYSKEKEDNRKVIGKIGDHQIVTIDDGAPLIASKDGKRLLGVAKVKDVLGSVEAYTQFVAKYGIPVQASATEKAAVEKADVLEKRVAELTAKLNAATVPTVVPKAA